MRPGGLTALASACLALIVGLTAPSAAELRLIAPSAPGSGWDQLAQALKVAFAETGGPALRVANQPGGGGTVGLAQFAGSVSNDELLVTGLTMTDASVLNRSHAGPEMMTPIARLALEPFALVVPANSPLKSLDDLRTSMTSGSGGPKENWAGGPVGGIDHVGAILFARALGLDAATIAYVPFLTSAEAAVAAGEERVQVAFLAASEVAAGLGEGKLRLLGISAAVPQAGLAAPLLAEAGIPLVYGNWRGIVARSGLPDADRLRIEALVIQAIAAPSWRAFLSKKGWADAYLGGEPFGALMRDDSIRVKEALKAAGIIKRLPD